MDKFYFIGIDVSKKKLDICVMYGSKVLIEEQVSNSTKVITQAIKHIKKELDITNDMLIICAEHTGQYTYPLICATKSIDCKLWLENPTQIKYSCGMTRGKNDKVDARRIATYAFRFFDKMKCYVRPSEAIIQLNQLQAERSMYVTDLAKYKAILTDQSDFIPKDIYIQKAKRIKVLMASLQQAISVLEKKMNEVISASAMLSRQMSLLTSIDGIGRVIAMNMIVATEAFTRFENARQFCCYAGVAPFSYTSGSSQRSQNRVSLRADKSIKSLLHLAAVAIAHRKDGELKEYFLRKVEEGKNKMTVINAIRAKLVSRMFSVVKNDRYYLPVLA